MKKKNILLISSISMLFVLNANAEFNFRLGIKSPSFISSDWDNDGLNNEVDNDDDNDGIEDSNDSTPFGRGGQSSVENVKVNSFNSNIISFLENEVVTLNWDIENERSLNLYDDEYLTNLISNVNNLNSYNVNPVNDTTYYLDTETEVVETTVYKYNENSRSCGGWTPDKSTVDAGQSFQQSRNCNVYYVSNEPNSRTISLTEYRTETGTRSNYGFTANDTFLVRFENNNISNNGYAQFISMTEMKIFDSNNDRVQYEARSNSDVLPRQDFWNSTSRDKTNINDGVESCSSESNGIITTLNNFNGSQKYAFLNFYTNKNFNFKRVVFTFADTYYKVPSKISIYKAINGDINNLVTIKEISNIPSKICYVEVSI